MPTFVANTFSSTRPIATYSTLHQYAPGVSRLLGEFLAASVLLSSNLKFEGRLILQVRSEGQVPLLMAECDHLLQIRGIARGAQEATSTSNDQLLHNGQLVITIDPTHGQRYQGITALQQGSLAHSLGAYFEQSEQLKTRLWLAADGKRAGGLLLQQLPAQITPQEKAQLRHWEHACSLATTVKDTELLNLDSEQMLHQLYHEDRVRLFEPSAVQFSLQLLPRAHPQGLTHFKSRRHRRIIGRAGQHHHGL